MEFLKQSFIYKIFFILLIKPYNQSNFKNIVDKIVFYFMESNIYKKTDAYFDKSPSFLSSKVYRNINKIISLLNKLGNKLNSIMLSIAINSVVISKFKEINNKNYKYSLCIVLSLSIILALLNPIFAIVFLLGILIIKLFLLDYQKVTYLLAMYPFLDYGIRLCVPALGNMWDELLLVVMYGVWGYKWIFNRRKPSFKSSPLDLPVLFFLVSMVCVFIANYLFINVAIAGLRATIQYVLWFYAVFQIIDSPKIAKGVCFVFIIVVGIMAIHGVFQYIIGVEMPASWVDNKEAGVRTRVFSILTSPNILGSLMTLALPLTLAFANISKTFKHQAFFYFLSIMMTLTLIFTFSRGAWVGFAFAIALYVFLKDKRLFIPVIALGIFAIILVPSIGDRISYMLSIEYIESSLTAGRLVRWLTGLEILADQPIFGLGHGRFGGAVAINNNLAYLLNGEVVNTFYMDNYYLKMAVETGLFGLFFFMMVMFQIVVNGIRTIRITSSKEHKEIEIGILSGLFGVIIHNFVENVFEVPMMTSCFWLLVAVLMVYWHINYNARRACRI